MPSFSKTAALALAVLAALALPAAAQPRDGTPSKKLYCWDEGPRRICSDTLPPEAVNSARDEFNARSGLRSGEVQRALTAEERIAVAAEEAQRRVDQAAVDTRRRTEQAMLATFQSEDELRRVFKERIGIVDNNVETARYNVASLRDALATQLRTAGDRELAGQKIGDKQVADIRQRHSELLLQKRMQASFEQQRQALDVEIEQTVARYRLLKGIDHDAPAG
ncbi:hypothetical protein [Stenotrophomonas sp. YIM B06876]|uniref:hypothetical protein n=1 Tax=Stenotrophomonas sp. YIM B06876 TaxID=3060211 RepID=UPI002739FDA7|nr:hypothetical protein [Stenotrophomonas sp. YIM B06876]